MPKARKKKTPLTAGANSPDNTSSKPKASRTVIRRFHTLLKQRKTVEDGSEDAQRIDNEIRSLGGLETYQRMSSIGQSSDRGGGSHVIFINWLKQHGAHKRTSAEAGKLRLLEVGALKPDNYQSCSAWIDCSPIDLRSRHPAIKEQDFLLLDVSENTKKWDILSLSLVLNFVPIPSDRGKMLRMAYDMLKPDGYLFLALPLPCVKNSRYLTLEHLEALMRGVGFVQVEIKWKEGGKMVYWLYQKGIPKPTVPGQDFSKKRVLRTGNRNNFAILLS